MKESKGLIDMLNLVEATYRGIGNFQVIKAIWKSLGLLHQITLAGALSASAACFFIAISNSFNELGNFRFLALMAVILLSILVVYEYSLFSKSAFSRSKSTRIATRLKNSEYQYGRYKLFLDKLVEKKRNGNITLDQLSIESMQGIYQKQVSYEDSHRQSVTGPLSYLIMVSVSGLFALATIADDEPNDIFFLLIFLLIPGFILLCLPDVIYGKNKKQNEFLLFLEHLKFEEQILANDQ